ncbi:hypothetical protein CfE428DRAFT_6284 [Chthoniobacter flavus Ellin428]|uniref:Uncharacterized protein n=1 Tax=Chthoniobacter flavus Ellin428 TaxID=497964 RepID=B4DBJ3_9BACT|nr:hypothetical protein CfE428DRAFT_6284 [Chthoniobacter flavus Ellin428]TCO87181.1 hypothetical protein EV701_12318 [Chthoniobacter flavus]
MDYLHLLNRRPEVHGFIARVLIEVSQNSLQTENPLLPCSEW